MVAHRVELRARTCCRSPGARCGCRQCRGALARLPVLGSSSACSCSRLRCAHVGMKGRDGAKLRPTRRHVGGGSFAPPRLGASQTGCCLRCHERAPRLHHVPEGGGGLSHAPQPQLLGLSVRLETAASGIREPGTGMRPLPPHRAALALPLSLAVLPGTTGAVLHRPPQH